VAPEFGEDILGFFRAKVVHSVRPETSWWNSFAATIGKFMATYTDIPLRRTF
jgi:uncharacterized membrane protein